MCEDDDEHVVSAIDMRCVPVDTDVEPKHGNDHGHAKIVNVAWCTTVQQPEQQQEATLCRDFLERARATGGVEGKNMCSRRRRWGSDRDSRVVTTADRRTVKTAVVRRYVWQLEMGVQHGEGRQIYHLVDLSR